MPIHVAILKPPYLRLILDGHKTVESRLSKSPIAPYQQINPGQRIFFKASGGPFMATAVAGETTFYDHLTPQRIEQLQRQYNAQVRGQHAYWQSKHNSAFASFITLTHVEPINTGPTYQKSPYRAWFVLDDDKNPLAESTLTAGAITNRYVYWPPQFATPHGQDITLILPDGRRIETDLVSNRRLRWRGWKDYFHAANAQPGDKVRFVILSPNTYRVTVRSPENPPA